MGEKLSKIEISEKVLDKKVLFIGLDGATKKIIDKLIEQKKLPAIERIVNTGAYFNCRSFEPVASPVIWTSIATGKKPEKHRIKGFYDTAYNLTAKRIWDIFSALGFPVGILGHFVTWPPEKINGFVIPDILALDEKCYPEQYGFMWKITHDGKNERRISTKMLLKYFWQSYINGIKLSTLLKAGTTYIKMKIHFMDELDALFNMRLNKTMFHRDLFMQLSKIFNPRYAFIHIHFLDVCSHRFWKYMEPELYENISETMSLRHSGKIYEAYRYVDKIIKNIIDSVDSNTLIVIASDHGFRGGKRTTHWIGNVMIRIQRFEKLFNVKGDLNFSIVEPRIHVSLRNFTPERNRHYKTFLQSIEIFEDKKPLFEVEEIFHGHFILEFNSEIIKISGKHILIDGKLIPIEELLVSSQDFTSGIHDVNDGILILNGPGVKQNVQQRDPVSVFDITPTILTLCNLPVGRDMDGVVITDAIETGFLQKYPIQYIDTYEDFQATDKNDDKKDLNEKDSEKLKDHLRDLGYL